MRNPDSKTVMILGANGRFGHAATQAFAEAGWHVIAQHRPGRQPQLPDGVVRLECDATDSQALINAARRGVEVVVNALSPHYARWEQNVPPLAAAVLRLSKATGALLMLPGNVYNFGKTLPENLREDTPERPDTGHGRVRVALEQGMRDAASLGVDSVVIRAGDYLGGAQRGTWLDLTMGRRLAQGQLTYPGPADRLHCWAYLPDLARTFVAVANQRHRLKGFSSFHFAGYCVTGAQFLAACERAMGHPLKMKQQSWLVMRLLGLVWPLVGAVVEMRYLWQRPHRLDDRRLRELIGVRPQTPLDQALAAAIRDLHLAEPEMRAAAA